MFDTKQQGFTIIELVVVIVVIGILAAVALPRFLSLQDRAHDAVVEGTQASLASGVIMAKAVWLAEGRDDALDNILEKDIISCVDATLIADCGGGTTPPTEVTVSMDANDEGYIVSHSQYDPIGATLGDSTPNKIGANPQGEDACVEIFEFLLSESSVKTMGKSEADAATTGGTTSADIEFEFSAAATTDVCTYSYLPDIADNQTDPRQIQYDTKSGRVTVDFLSDSGTTSQ